MTAHKHQQQKFADDIISFYNVINNNFTTKHVGIFMDQLMATIDEIWSQKTDFDNEFIYHKTIQSFFANYIYM